jgi:hypothetical protein
MDIILTTHLTIYSISCSMQLLISSGTGSMLMGHTQIHMGLITSMNGVDHFQTFNDFRHLQLTEGLVKLPVRSMEWD